MKEKQSRDELRKEMDENVFIARSNDPFGYSTKWEKRYVDKIKTIMHIDHFILNFQKSDKA